MIQQTFQTQLTSAKREKKHKLNAKVKLPYEIQWIIERINYPIAGFEHLSTENGSLVSKEEQIVATKQQLSFIAVDLSTKGKSTSEIIGVLKYYMR